MDRVPEREYMDDPMEAEAYALTDFSEVNECFVCRFFELLPLQGKLFVLDLGCGPGDITIRIYKRLEHGIVIGMDASQAMLEYAKCDERSHKVSWVLGDVKRLPFLERSVDVIVSNSLLHHLIDPVPLWLEVKRVMKRGGFLFLRDLFRPESKQYAWEIVERYAGDASGLLKEEYYRSLLSAFTVEEVKKHLNDIGLSHFVVEEVTDRHMDIYGVL